jgi:hypothetical protein
MFLRRLGSRLSSLRCRAGNHRFLRRVSACSAALAMSWAASASSGSLSAFMVDVNDVFQGHGDSFEKYIELHDEYRVMTTLERKQAGQLMSMADAMFGRYQDADAHYADSFPSKPPSKCPAPPFQSRPVADAIAGIAGNARVLMLNESHSSATTRAVIINALAALHRDGFTAIALEALNPNHANPFTDTGEKAPRSYVRDDNKSGFYLREPVYAQLVSEARRLGFVFVAYEGSENSHDKREAQQAANLKHWIDEHPESRLVVIGGYSHIWKTSDWMAGKLMGTGMRSVVSVDQIDGINGCVGQLGKGRPALWVTPDGHAWSSHPDRVDATITGIPPSARGQGASWLTLDGRRRSVEISHPCAGARPCLLEARRRGEEDSVPEDRLVLFSKNERATLYVAPGSYVLTSRTKVGKEQTTLEVDVASSAR